MPELPMDDPNKLSVKNVNGGDLLVVNDPGEIVNFKEKDERGQIKEIRSRLQLKFTLPDGSVKYWALNKKSYRNLSKAWGPNSSGDPEKGLEPWTGRVCMVGIEDSQQFGEFIVLFPTKNRKEDEVKEVPF